MSSGPDETCQEKASQDVPRCEYERRFRLGQSIYGTVKGKEWTYNYPNTPEGRV